MLFSQRNGLKTIRTIAQEDSMDDDLRNLLWNILDVYYWQKSNGEKMFGNDQYERPIHHKLVEILRKIWGGYFKNPLDTLEDYWSDNLQIIRKYFFSFQWFEVYDFIEFIAQCEHDALYRKTFTIACNKILEQELSAYRFVGDVLVKITSDEEIKAIKNAMQNPDKFTGVKTHINEAVARLSDRKNPDYRNSIKESISAVEAACCVISEDNHASLGRALKLLEKQGKIELHPAFESGLNSLYGYTCDADGIRHALTDESNVDFADAKFMLVVCSAFVNYLIDKSK